MACFEYRQKGEWLNNKTSVREVSTVKSGNISALAVRVHNPGSLKQLSTLLALAIILHQPRCGLTRCIWLLSFSISLPSKNEETNPSAPGQQILGLIGDKSDGSARLSNCDGAVSRRKKASPTSICQMEGNWRRWSSLVKLNRAALQTKRGSRSQRWVH